MEIEYLNLMLRYPILQDVENVPVKEEDIIKLETKIDKVFPKVYKEFLSIAGENANVIAFLNHGFYDPVRDDIYYVEEQQEYTKNKLKKYGVSIGGDFWVIADLDGGGQFDFFYFNDADAEDPENPPVYASYPDLIEDNDPDFPLKKKLANTFQEYIEEKIKGYANLK
ncbi:SMI1/KNR4 family protein [uncultured Dokdonia sp.]|uniref:SMI1/KNR4 family protein n=1 Tax=uncultured Dokdonia sp. TaxID=575653 RepID=UPI0026246031|nr:SMI1/KNR4 family protein [uncultured Dokdonia sp.]